MSVANLKNVFSNQGAAPLKAPGTSFLHGNKVNGVGGPAQSSTSTESKINGRWGNNNNNSISNNIPNGFGNGESKFQNGGKVVTPHPPLEKRQSSEHFGVTLKRVSLGETSPPDNRSFLHSNGPTSPPVSKTPASPPASNKPSLFKVADNTKFVKAQQEKSPTSPSNTTSTDSTLRKLNVERTFSDSSPLTNGFHGATANKSNLFGSAVKLASAPGTLKTPFSRANLNKVNSIDETDSAKPNAMSPTSKFGQTTVSANSIVNGVPKNAPRTEVAESKIAASKTISVALSPRAKPMDLKFSPSSTTPALAAKPSTQIPRKGSDASPTSASADRMRLKFDDSEKKRKALIGENQKGENQLYSYH